MNPGDLIITKRAHRADHHGKDICILLDKIKIKQDYYYNIYCLYDAEYDMMADWALEESWELLA